MNCTRLPLNVQKIIFDNIIFSFSRERPFFEFLDLIYVIFGTYDEFSRLYESHPFLADLTFATPRRV